jgi:hypothetical protein
MRGWRSSPEQPRVPAIFGSGVDVLIATGAPGVEGRADEVRATTAGMVARLKGLRCSDSPAVPRRTCRGGRWLWLEDGLVDLMHEKSPNHVSEVRKGGRKVQGPEGGSMVSPECQFPMKTVAEVRCYGEQFEQPGGSELRGGRMGKERRARGSYRRGLEGHSLAK